MKNSAKNVISLFLTFAISLAVAVPALAVERDKNNQLLQNDNSKFSVSRVLTFNEIVEEIAKDHF
ncbi:hypothetical protein FL966_06255 [Caproiciproducens galactitolivorans]|uniref:Uncharacterized protein n=1 Tax=Caproiciproducens galactitolivorans TaxID=642589 RepID=A0A4Z0YA40_9FIRM|nr:hypothetical protein [Caproiciproducens galactitolivorans]QEY34689.1 hypothetical protein FL966_06255 [Caproiciproducens galactitolivorans]TGJ75840.1 hypothetical protein CAGA_20470 [Caproiciproducens galactitolivorans]